MKKLRPGETQGHAGVSGSAKTQVTWLQSALSLTRLIAIVPWFNYKEFLVIDHLRMYYSDQVAILQVVIITIITSILHVRKQIHISGKRKSQNLNQI